MDNKKVLIISYFFPPRPGVGSNRIKGLYKYLPIYGWDPIILTPILPGCPAKDYNLIQTNYKGDVSSYFKHLFGLRSQVGLQEQIGICPNMEIGNKVIINKFIKLIKSVLVFPDEQIFWYWPAIKSGSSLLKAIKCSAIISSSSPVTAHLIAKTLKRRFCLPWIADLRDLWTQNHYYSYGVVRKIIERNLELRTLKHADALVTISEPLARKLRSLHNNKTIWIPNGYDPDEVKSSKVTRYFTITYTGQLYNGKRNPKILFEAINKLIKEGAIEKEIVKLRFYGDNSNWLNTLVSNYGLNEVVDIKASIPRELSLEKQRESQLLLLILWDHKDELGACPAKVFEYLSAKRPIIALGNEKGVVAKLLRDTNSGICVNSLNSLIEVLKKYYRDYKEEGLVKYQGDWEKIENYSQHRMAERFAHLLDSLINKNGSSGILMGRQMW